jgi:Citrate transporter
MTVDQALAFAIILGTIGLLIWDRIRYDLVALLALTASIGCGIVEPQHAFRGFSDDIVIIVGSALVVSAAIGRSGLVEALMTPLVPRMRTSAMQVAVLTSAVTALSAFIKNVGALAIFIPIAVQVARRTEKPASRVLMPLAFGSLLGGLITLIGTSPNIIVSQMRQQITGEPFRMFDFAPVGVCLAAVGVAFLTIGWRLLPAIKRGAGATPETRFSIEDCASVASLALRWQDRPGSRSFGRWRRHHRHDHPRGIPPQGAGDGHGRSGPNIPFCNRRRCGNRRAGDVQLVGRRSRDDIRPPAPHRRQRLRAQLF